MNPVRHYLDTVESGAEAVERIISLIGTGAVEPLIGIDLETQPIEGLEGYPRRAEDEDGKIKWPTKTQQRKYWLELTERLFPNIALLRELDIYPPTKKQTKKAEREGVPAEYALVGKNANAAWALMRSRVSELMGTTAGFQMLAKSMVKYDSTLLKLWAHFLAVAEDPKRIVVDPVEPGLDPYTTDIFTVQMTVRHSNGLLESWLWNCARMPVDVIKPILSLPVKFMGANIKFDLKQLLHKVQIAPENVFCSQISSKMLYLGLKKVRHSLASVAERYAGLKMDKTARKSFIGVRNVDLTPEQLDYAFLDTEVLFPVYDEIFRRADELGMTSLIDTFSRLSYITAVWELEGYLVDQQKWMEIASEVVKKRDLTAEEVEKMLLPPGYAETFGIGLQNAEEEDEDEEIVTDDDDESESGVDGRKNAIIRISQRALVVERLKEVLGMPITKGIGKDARNVLDAEYRNKHQGKPHPFFEAYSRWAKLSKQASTYGATFLWAIHPLTGRVHPTFKIAGTETGRYSCVKPNMLNIPTVKSEDDVDFRAAFLAFEGFLFGNADYNGMEQRIAGDISQDPTLLKIFEEDKDSHNVTAAMMFHIRQSTDNENFEPYEEETDFQYGIETLKIRRVVFPKRYTFEQMFALATSEWVEGLIIRKKTRDRAKTVGFLWYFGGMAFTLAVKTNMPLRLAEDFFVRYEATYPVLAEKFRYLGQLPLTTQRIETEDGTEYGYATAYNGLRRWWELPKNPSRYDYPDGPGGLYQFEEAQKRFRRRRGSIEREARNVPTQGGNAVITAEALLLLQKRGRKYGIRPALSIYDEILILVPEKFDQGKANALLEQCMSEPGEKYFTTVECKAEANPLSKYWKKW